MSNVQLTKRLLRIADMVPRGTFLADIGTDHAFLPIYLLKNSIIERAVAADIVDGPLEIARRNIKAHNLEDKLKVVKSDGLVKVEAFTPQTVVIAGMGGETIYEILRVSEFAKASSPLFILQPMTHIEVLRDYLLKNGFSILDEQVIREEHRFYVIISAKFLKNQQHYFKTADFNEICELGAITPRSCEDARDYLIWKKNTLQRNVDALKNSTNSKEKAEIFSKIIFEIDRRLKNYA